MILAAVGVLLALAALSLGLRTTSLLMARAHPLVRLAVSSLVGTILVLATLQISDRYRLHDLGLGLLLSLAPVGVFDLTKWWFLRRPAAVTAPASWLVENVNLLPRGGTVLDVACGRGRHALWLADRGFEVHAIDRSAEAIAELNEAAKRLALRLTTEVVDLETDPPPSLGTRKYDVVLGFNYLHRPLMPALLEVVKPGGRIFYETFTSRQAERGHPRNPAFLLNEGELAELMAPFTILSSREGDIEGRFIASIVAERTPGSQ